MSNEKPEFRDRACGQGEDAPTVISLFCSLGVIASLGLVLLLGYAIGRTGSSHILMSRLWRLASGGAEVQDERIRTYLQDQHALMSFRFVTGVRVSLVKSVAACYRLTESGAIVGDTRGWC